VCCTTVGIERLAHRWGVDIQRLGPPHRSGGGLLVAARIDCTERTIAALTEGRAPARAFTFHCNQGNLPPVSLTLGS
jgi:N-acyl-L-homoserine lactone synthetase